MFTFFRVIGRYIINPLIFVDNIVSIDREGVAKWVKYDFRT